MSFKLHQIITFDNGQHIVQARITNIKNDIVTLKYLSTNKEIKLSKKELEYLM